MEDRLKEYDMRIEHSEAEDREPIDFDIRDIDTDERCATVWGSNPFEDIQVDCEHPEQAIDYHYDEDHHQGRCEKMLPLGYDITGKEERFKTIFKNKKNYFRKYRDMSIFAFAGVYMLAVIDAYVDAELSSFDISKDLSMSWGPTVIQQSPKGGLMQRQTAPGIQCNITF